MRSLCLSLAAVCLFALPAAAQVRVEVNAGQGAQGRADTTKAKMAHRTSKIVGLSVKNEKAEDLGKIEDLVMDETGQIRYGVISFGGFLGFNNKLFAVPFKALQIKHDPGSSDNYVQLTGVSKARLEQADGFPSDKWPDFTDDESNKKIDAYWLKPDTGATTLPRDTDR
jgi:sporulation protein YlmC with PRC-barrel domain